ncbi:tRNA cyclic N6-threonylcarbamoyladenosine(37) synthase TcdA [Pseudoduganella chitinolytica]|uniref:tRNA cyclic N6-threonylcarbamoyladenosine(37) synthase TcdA n=1 Tax=Pseudoduganella chitinolytica TaxID=34070 RepID=A0ABY8BAL9_9BURK|nr:tRNA cyclic N6-threonylcarbamoyladenosine(37) synthase TcdA [Pseudoduganella chitinolytica]WEF31414.1 tRNA cyclic N6-threonylcarbamoyladenosine(37) synthase TcdA [Pseudoduganella chitinolytica]
MNDLTSSSVPAAHDIDFDRRFGGIARLYGDRALARFRAAHICVIGVGGVGSWIVEALARSAVGRLTLIDLDNVAESNINRQIQALTGTIGMAKITALTQRIAGINPYCQVTEIEDFVTPDNLDEMIGGHDYDYVIDAMDSARAKTALVHYCRTKGIPLIVIGSAGGQTDPTRIEVRDLARTEQEPLLKKVRRRLRSQFNYPANGKNKLGVDAVFSMEPLKFPETGEVCSVDGDELAAAAQKPGLTGINCAGFGSAMVVTATFGMVAAGHLLRKLAEEPEAAEAAEAAEA